MFLELMFASVSARPPGFTAAPSTGARVAAMQRSTTPTATVARSSDHGAGTFFLGASQQWATLLLLRILLRMTTTCVSRRTDTPWSPVCVNPATGERVVLVKPPPGFVQVSNQLGGQQEAASALPSFQGLLVSQA